MNRCEDDQQKDLDHDQISENDDATPEIDIEDDDTGIHKTTAEIENDSISADHNSMPDVVIQDDNSSINE